HLDRKSAALAREAAFLVGGSYDRAERQQASRARIDAGYRGGPSVTLSPGRCGGDRAFSARHDFVGDCQIPDRELAHESSATARRYDHRGFDGPRGPGERLPRALGSDAGLQYPNFGDAPPPKASIPFAGYFQAIDRAGDF